MKYFLASFLHVWITSILLSLGDSCSFSFSRTRRRSSTAWLSTNAKTIIRSQMTLCHLSETASALEVYATSEVVGGHGKIGSLFLKEEGAIAVPRGVAPGCLTTRNGNGSPIIVAIPPEEWKFIWDITLSHRKSDLVWVTNGQEQLLSSWQQNSTVVWINGDFHAASPSSPPVRAVPKACIYGKHAAAMQNFLTRQQITEVLEMESWTEMLQFVERASDFDAGEESVRHPSDATKMVPIPAIDMVCTGEPTKNKKRIQSAIVVGGGIIGSSIARALAQRGLTNVTVYDPNTAGIATPASWAWLNANHKPPHAYKSLNQMGLRGWRSDALFSNLDSLKWTGTLVQTKEKLELTGGYTAEGPQSMERIQELEPEANFTNIDGSYVYYFADEGHVDPQEAVLALRQEAMENGVSFVSDERVIGLVRNVQDDRVTGVKTSSRDDFVKDEPADVVIVAAGASSSDKALGGVPLVHNPSKTYFGSPSSTSSPKLTRTLVDMVSSLYLAQRPDGTVVAGGGAIKFGLSATNDTLPPKEIQRQLSMAQELAQQLAPNPVGASPLTHKKEVISKPMPKDGFPILGFVEPGLYSAVTHSGMTLSPLIGQLVAAEVKEQVSLTILNDFRPTRFDREKEKNVLNDWQESDSA